MGTRCAAITSFFALALTSGVGRGTSGCSGAINRSLLSVYDLT